MLLKPPACQGCPFYGDGLGFVPDDDPTGAEVLFVWQNPGEAEEHQGRPAVGVVGQTFRRQFAEAHLAGRRYAFANVIKCRWNHANKLPPLRSKVWKEAREHCRPYLNETLAKAPRAIRVVCGEYGADAWGQPATTAPMLHLRGTWLECARTLLMMHPATLLPNRQPELRDVFHADMRRLGRLLGGGPAPYQDDFRHLDDPDALGAWLGDTTETLVALDLETDADWNVNLIGLALNSQTACTVLPTPEMLSVLHHLLPHRVVVVHYAEGIEQEWLAAQGIRPGRLHDLHKLLHAWDPEYAYGGDDENDRAKARGSGALAFAQSLFTWRPYHKHLLAQAEHRQDAALKRHYCMLDCVVTAEAFLRLRVKMATEAPRQLAAYEAHGAPMLPVLVAARETGLLVDPVRWRERQVVLQADAATAVQDAYAAFGDTIRPKTKKAKQPIGIAALKKTLIAQGVKLSSKRRADGRRTPTLDREARRVLLASHPQLESLERYFSAVDTLSDCYHKKIISVDGRVHPHWSGFLRTWRWRSRQPNATQWPRQERGVFVAPPGQVIVGVDASAGEYRWWAGESQDVALLTTFRDYDTSGRVESHPHVLNAMVLFKASADEVVHWKRTEDARYTFAKNFIYWIIYAFRGGEDSLRPTAAKAGLEFSGPRMRRLRADLLERCPQGADWRAKHVAACTESRQVECREWGYRRLLHGRSPENEALNYPMAAGLSGLVNHTILAVWEAHGQAPCLYLNDGLYYYTPENDWEPLARTLHGAMTTPLKTLANMVIPADLSVGDRMGSLKKVAL